MDMLYLSLSGNPRTFTLKSINPTTFALSHTIRVTSYNMERGFTHNILRYQTGQLRGFGDPVSIFYIDLQAAIPYWRYGEGTPVCHMFTFGEDGLHFGKSIFEYTDTDDNYQFGNYDPAFRHDKKYAFGVTDCRFFDFACVSNFEVTLVCLRPPTPSM